MPAKLGWRAFRHKPKASERLVPLESWWLNPDTFYAKAKSEKQRMTAISTNYRRKTEDFTRGDSL